MESTDRDEELLDLFQGVSHSGISFRRGSEHFDEHVQVVIEVEVFRFSTFPQLFLLKKIPFKMWHVEIGKTKQSKNCPKHIWHMLVMEDSATIRPQDGFKLHI